MIDFVRKGKSTKDATAVASDILQGKTAYANNEKITGSMNNNGQLIYDISTSEQTIPAGYTSGGSIAASPQTQEDYNECLIKTYQILGNETVYNDYIISDFLHVNSSKTIDFGIKVELNNIYKLKLKDTTINGFEAYIGTSVNINTYLCRDANKATFYNTNNISKNLNIIPTTTPEEVEFKFLNAAENNILSGTTAGSQVGNADYDFYYLKVYDSSNNLINNFIPARKISTDKIGLLDTITLKFIEY